MELIIPVIEENSSDLFCFSNSAHQCENPPCGLWQLRWQQCWCLSWGGVCHCCSPWQWHPEGAGPGQLGQGSFQELAGTEGRDGAVPCAHLELSEGTTAKHRVVAAVVAAVVAPVQAWGFWSCPWVQLGLLCSAGCCTDPEELAALWGDGFGASSSPGCAVTWGHRWAPHPAAKLQLLHCIKKPLLKFWFINDVVRKEMWWNLRYCRYLRASCCYNQFFCSWKREVCYRHSNWPAAVALICDVCPEFPQTSLCLTGSLSSLWILCLQQILPESHEYKYICIFSWEYLLCCWLCQNISLWWSRTPNDFWMIFFSVNSQVLFSE